jgi:hypothetical protein
VQVLWCVLMYCFALNVQVSKFTNLSATSHITSTITVLHIMKYPNV